MQSLYLLRRIGFSQLYISTTHTGLSLLCCRNGLIKKNIQGSYVTPKFAVVFSSFLLLFLELSGSNFDLGSS